MSDTLFAEQLSRNPDGLAIVDAEKSRTWRELHGQVHALARYLQNDRGIKPGEHIALVIGNRLEYIEAMLAGILAGVWVTPMNTHLTAAEVDYIRTDCGASAVLCDDAHEAVLRKDGVGEIINIQKLSPQLLAQPPVEPIGSDAVCGGSMLYTSGTTGRPKGVRRAKPDTVAEAIARLARLGVFYRLTGKGAHLVTGPLYHAAPGMFAIYDMLNGATVVIMSKWDNQRFFSLVEEHRVVTTHLVPTMFVRLLAEREEKGVTADLSTLQYVLHGAAPIAPAVKRRMIEWWGPMLTEYWGGTESGIVTMVDTPEWETHPGTVGRAIGAYSEVFVGDEQGNPSTAEEGMLFCRHKDLAQIFTYHGDADKTAKAHPQPYVLCLGDIGRVDEDGFVYLSDRESNMIISGGVNIYPQEVEQALMEHADIVDVAVFGIANDEWGEEVHSVIQLRQGVVPSDELVEQIRLFAREHLAGFKVPRKVHFVSEVPRNPTGKVLIRELREQYSQPQG